MNLFMLIYMEIIMFFWPIDIYRWNLYRFHFYELILDIFKHPRPRYCKSTVGSHNFEDDMKVDCKWWCLDHCNYDAFEVKTCFPYYRRYSTWFKSLGGQRNPKINVRNNISVASHCVTITSHCMTWTRKWPIIGESVNVWMKTLLWKKPCWFSF